MTFSAEDKLKAMAIVSVFETGHPFGKFSTVAVLDDGAGISYGFSQFTHRSGSLAAVLERYLSIGGTVGAVVIKARMSLVRRINAPTINELSADTTFRNALRAAGITDEMKQAQVDIAIERFLQPAVDECTRLGFTSPVTLAVVYDSMTHGSWQKIRDRVRVTPSGVTSDIPGGVTLSSEQLWIINYVIARDAWLASIPRLAATRYRTRFFAKQIASRNWELNLPIRVQGVTISNATIDTVAKYFACREVPQTSSAVEIAKRAETRPSWSVPPSQAETRPVGSVPQTNRDTSLDKIELAVNAAAARYDQVERIATTAVTRNDAAKSLWTTVAGSLTQTFWALFGLVAGVPREVWLVVAVIIAVLMVMYLYRQIALGKIRDGKSYGFSRDQRAGSLDSGGSDHA